MSCLFDKYILCLEKKRYMKSSPLLPSKYKVFGWILFLIASGLFVYCNIIYPNAHNDQAFEIPGFTSNYPDVFSWSDDNLTGEAITTVILIGLLMICFSKEKKEDEYITLIRLRSWQWAVLTSFGILIAMNLLVYGAMFMGFVFYNTLTILIVFIAKFYYSLFRLNRERLADEK